MGDTILALDPSMKEYCGYVEAMVGGHIFCCHVLPPGAVGCDTLLHRLLRDTVETVVTRTVVRCITLVLNP